MSRKRDLRDDERALWDEVMRDVRRLRGGKAPKAKSEKKRTREPPDQAGSAAVVTSVPAAKSRRAPAFGLDGATVERLKRGKIEPDATIDLHGLTQAQAHARLLSFVRRAYEHGFRCILVVTGKGAPRPLRDDAHFTMPERSRAGVLRLMVPRWLEEERALVVGVQSAHQRHGGAGAFYAYLRRKR